MASISKIEQLDAPTHMDKLHRRGHQIALSSWIAQFHDPISILDRYRLPANPKNFAGWENPLYTALLERAAASPDPLPAFVSTYWLKPKRSSPKRCRSCPYTIGQARAFPIPASKISPRLRAEAFFSNAFLWIWKQSQKNKTGSKKVFENSFSQRTEIFSGSFKVRSSPVSAFRYRLRRAL